MVDDIPLGVLLGLLALLIACAAFFAGTETALLTLNRYRLRHRAAKGHRGAQLAEALLRRPDRLIGLILLGSTLVNMLAASLVTLLALQLGGPALVLVATVALTVVMLIFGEVTPKTLGALHPERLAFPSTYVYWPLLKVTAPLISLVTLFSNGVLRLFGVRPEKGTAQHISMDELRTLLAESAAVLPRKRHEMMMRILELGEITVEDIMVPYAEVEGLDLDDPWDVIVERIRNSGYTRLPLYRESLDNVTGILHLKRLMQYPEPSKLDKAAIERLADEPYFVPEATPLNKQLVQFQRARQRVGIVVDEYGEVQGLVTLEDILEEIVGEFTSEPSPGQPEVRRDEAGDGYLVDGAANVRVLNRMMHWRLPTEGAKTINGLVVEKLDRIPAAGASVEVQGYTIEVLATSGSAVESVRVRAPVPSAVSAEQAAAELSAR